MLILEGLIREFKKIWNICMVNNFKIAFAGLVNQIFRNKIYRVTHANDFVPRYPIIDNEGRIFQHHEREYDTSPAWDPGNQLMYKCEGYEFDGIVLAGENPV
ncbi:hypothetical protein G9A89_010952 [Geosiphon pyriformis]|nr:hypothetical protein G9A89_010952 [Geosiphon pyriformis]